MRRFVISFLCFVCMTATYGRDYHYNTKFSINKKNFVDTIDIEWHRNQIYIKGFVGDKPCRINFDTGSSMGMISENFLNDEYRHIGTLSSRDANGKVSPVRVVMLPDVRIGSLVLSHYPATIRPKQPINVVYGNIGANYDLLLGFDLINKGLIVKIDTKAGKMIITDRQNFFHDKGYIADYRLVRYAPNLKINVFKDCYDEAIFDTGSPFLYEMSRNSIKHFMLWTPDFKSLVKNDSTGRKTVGIHSIEESSNNVMLLFEELRILGFDFKNLSIGTTKGNSRIGAEILNYGSIIIDGKKRKILFSA